MKVLDLTPKTSDILIDSDFLTADEAARYLRKSRNALYAMNLRRSIPFYPLGRRVLYLRSELRKFVLQNRVASIVEVTK